MDDHIRSIVNQIEAAANRNELTADAKFLIGELNSLDAAIDSLKCDIKKWHSMLGRYVNLILDREGISYLETVPDRRFSAEEVKEIETTAEEYEARAANWNVGDR